MIIDENTIKNFIEKCRVENFTPNSFGIIDNDDLSDVIDEMITNIINSIDENIIEEIINKKIKAEIETATINNTAKMLNIFYLVATSTYNYVISKYYKEEDMYKKVLGNIARYSLELFTQIFSLYLSGCTMGILSQIRVLYENYVIFNYIGKHPELAQCYYDHAVYKKYVLSKDYWKNLTQKEQEEMELIENKYDDTFADDFGWIFKTIKERNKRKIITMAEELELLDYTELYKVSSNYIHPSSFSVFHTKIIDGLLPKYILTSIEMITNNVMHLMKYYNSDEKVQILIRNVMYGLREDLYSEPKIYEI
jgi:nitrogenase subunit NifH